MVSLYIAVTDWDWFDHLRTRPNLAEVNFWKPGGMTEFKALKRGELFIFKLHSPRNFIVGVGIFWYATILPTSLAWDTFGEANGAASLDEMRARISKYRRAPLAHGEDQRIGCRLLQQPIFLDKPLWLAVPASWSRTIVSGKRYTTDDPEGLKLWETL
ncbi:MAG: HNH endonuclease, partial [Alphaproteobacteria bacterium]